MERKSSAYLNSDDMFSTYAQKTYMENIPCELALTRVTVNDTFGVVLKQYYDLLCSFLELEFFQGLFPCDISG